MFDNMKKMQTIQLPLLVFAIVAVVSCQSTRTPSPVLASQEPYRSRTRRVTMDDPAQDILQDWKKETKARYNKQGLIRPDFGPWSEIESKPLQKLFPSHRFFTISWNEMPIDPDKGDTVGRAFGLYVTLAVDQNSGKKSEHFGFGNYEKFGTLLKHNSISIRTQEDARLVWDAFCDLHKKHWKNQGIKRIDSATWHLGVITIDDFHYYYRVTLDAQGVVQDAKLHADKVR
jgi:hypothetical protein